MALLTSILILVLGGYGGLAALMYFAQRKLMHLPENIRMLPADAGFPEAEEVLLDTADGMRVVVWHVAPKTADRPIWLFLHGNAGSLRLRVDRFRELTAHGDGLVALSYRGYSGSTGRPTEAGLIEDARAAYSFAVACHGASRIVPWGESLGTGVTVALAAERPVWRVVLELPFFSAVDVAAGVYPFLPVRILMKDQFRSDLRAEAITAPVLIMHGERDTVVPIASGERLYRLIKSPKRFVRFPGAGHDDLGGLGAVATARKFVEEKFE